MIGAASASRCRPRGRTLYHGAHDAFLSHLAPLLDGRTAAARREILDFLGGAIRVIRAGERILERCRAMEQRIRTANVSDAPAGTKHLRPVRLR
jgi:hypothetical protein